MDAENNTLTVLDDHDNKINLINESTGKIIGPICKDNIVQTKDKL